MKTCSKCKEEKNINDFPIKGKGKLHSWCKKCKQKQRKQYQKENPDIVKKQTRKTKLKSNYGITVNDLEKMYANQEGKCKICDRFISIEINAPTNIRAHVDHNHKNLAVRSLLCSFCNTGIGLFNEDVQVLQKAIDYLTI